MLATETIPAPMSIQSQDGTVKELTIRFKERWWGYETSLPDLGLPYTPGEKNAREIRVNKSLNRALVELEKGAHSPADFTEEHFTALFGEVAQATFDLEDRHIEAIRAYGLIDATRQFVQLARRFDPEISAEDIYQASRNAWSMNLMQLLIGLPVEATPSVLAYSLLYPYTDNVLDHPSISFQDKLSFSHRFHRRLEGENTRPANVHEQKIFELVGVIESQYDRWDYPEVYNSLLAIYRAQMKSLRLLRPQASPYEMDVLGISFEKGGTSVLADGYLVAGRLAPSQQEFMYHYGSFTQLMDDLEDIEVDRRSGLTTIFSQTASRWPLDAVTNRTFRFGMDMLDAMDRFTTPGLEPLKEMVRLCLTPLLILSVSQAHAYYSRPYLHTLETYFPVRFSFLKKQNKRLQRKQTLLEGLLQTVCAH
jgi:hypothetical protein